MSERSACCGACGEPPARANPPGLDALVYRRGAYGATLARMRGRLSAGDLPALRGLTTRDPADPTMALLDAWACLSEVLSFYNERLVNEAYLRTCTEQRSALELARLVGYAPRPGTAAETFLSFTLEDRNQEAELVVPEGTRAYSTPGPGETMQPFETVETLRGRPRWSTVRPRQIQPQRISKDSAEIYLKGVSTGLRPGDALLFVFTNQEQQETYVLRKVERIELEPAELPTVFGPTHQLQQGRTRVVLQQPAHPRRLLLRPVSLTSSLLGNMLKRSTHSPVEPSHQPEPERAFQEGSPTALAAMETLFPAARPTLVSALRGAAPAGETGTVTVYAMRVKAAPHGHNAPLRVDSTIKVERTIKGENETEVTETTTINFKEWDNSKHSDPKIPVIQPEKPYMTLPLDAVYDQITIDSPLVIERPTKGGEPTSDKERFILAHVEQTETISRTYYNMPGRITQLTLDTQWYDEHDQWLSHIRNVTVYAQPERLELDDAPLTEEVKGDEIVLDGLYDGLAPGRLLLLSGERADLGGITGVRATELATIAVVNHDLNASEPTPPVTGDTPPAQEQTASQQQATNATYHTRLTLAARLTFSYVRSSVTIHANVARATHGESLPETLGSGSAARPLQVFGLRRPPLTYVSAPTPGGVASTLKVWVDDLRWRAAPDPTAVAPGERAYLVRHTADATEVVFGLGARLPTGRDNVRASYRSGIGPAGNVRAGQIDVLASRPNGVTGVTNPLPASGGAGPDSLGQLRRRVPLGLAALDRLVSLDDYADFARAFAGIGKADAQWFGERGTLHLTVAGVDDAPLATSSGLLQNLSAALKQFGDPNIGVMVKPRQVRLLALKARVRPLPDARWEALRPRIAAALLETFGFERRELGQPVYASQVLAAIQGVRGVASVNLVAFGALDVGTPEQPRTPKEVAQAAQAVFDNKQGEPVIQAQRAQASGRDNTITPAEIVYLAPGTSDILQLELDQEAPL